MQLTSLANLSQAGLSLLWEIPYRTGLYTLGENALEKEKTVFTNITVERVLTALAIRSAH